MAIKNFQITILYCNILHTQPETNLTIEEKLKSTKY